MAKICLGCLNPLPEGDDRCRICGFSAADKNPSVALPIKTLLQEHYIIGRMIHEGSDSLFYLGYDKILKEPCFIQEYYPGGLCSRDESGMLTPLGGCEAPYADYKNQFHGTMRALARMKDLAGIIPIYDIFEENGTTYAVSDYLAGETLTKKVELAGGRIPWQEARPLFMSLMSCVEQLAGAGIHHLAICPDNILIGEDGKPHLRSFSIAAARQVGSDLTPRLATGYAAPEQYDMDGIVGELTDVYGLAATIFRVATGNVPPAGNNRAISSDDLFMSADIANELTQQICVALFNSLQVSPADRTATVKRLHQQLSMEPNVSALLDEDANIAEKDAEKPKKTHTLLIVFGSVAAVLILIVGGFLLFFDDILGGDSSSEPVSTPPSYTAIPTSTQKKPQHSIPALIGKNYYDVLDNKDYKKFNIKLKYLAYSDKDADTILEQVPAAGTAVNKGATIELTVSLGKDDTITMPDLRNWEEAHAKTFLEYLGMDVEIAKIYTSSVADGLVEESNPPADASIKRGDTITLRVSYVDADESSADTDENADEESDE